MPYEHSGRQFCSSLFSLRIKPFHFLSEYNITCHTNTLDDSYVHLSSHLASNLSFSSTNTTLHAIWTLFSTVVFTSFHNSYGTFPLPERIQHHMLYEHSLWRFYSHLFSLHTKPFHFLNEHNITYHTNTSHKSSVHPFCHFASNLSSSSTNTTSHTIRTLLTTVLFISLLTSHQIFPLSQLIQHHMPYEHFITQLCSPLFSLRIKPFHFLI
jgi:hypothetical protein